MLRFTKARGILSQIPPICTLCASVLSFRQGGSTRAHKRGARAFHNQTEPPSQLTHNRISLDLTTTPPQSNTHQWISSLHSSPFRLSLTLPSPSPPPSPLTRKRRVAREMVIALSRRRHGPLQDIRPMTTR
jgi:hypothetical protein